MTQNQPNKSNQQRQLALFDLDHTLLDIDSDYTWGEYIVKQGLVNEREYRQANQVFYEQYIAGTLNAVEYNEFVADFLTTLPMNKLQEHRVHFIKTEIEPHIRKQGIQAIRQHRQQGDDVVIISATNDFIVTAIAELLDVPASHVLATPLQVIDNRYTGKLSDKPNFQAGKLYHLKNWLSQQQNKGIVYHKTLAYSDSKNDLPLLEWADKAICVTPDEVLAKLATKNNWQVVDWRNV